jgi:rare lipoprotein A
VRGALALAACLAAAPASPQAKAATSEAKGAETGIASWYGPDFHGKPTSSGEIYDKEKLSCAHRTLPFGSYVLVRNLDNGSSVVVRVNDRGPFAKNRIIDLSEAAARIVGMIPTGTARVSIEVIPEEEALAWKGGSLAGQGAAPGAQGAAAIPSGARVRIQVASYASEANAAATQSRLAASGLSASIEAVGGRYRVAFPDLSPEESRDVSLRLDGLGYRGYTVTTIRPAK